MFSKEKGITLVALVVTIVVLLILAGISITMITGDNGLMKKAREGKTNWTNAQNYESETFTGDSGANKIDELVKGE